MKMAADEQLKPNAGFKALWRFLPMLWPKGEAELKARVVFAMAMVLAGKAVTLASPADVRAENCAFGPHAALFHVRGSDARESQVDLHNCSTMLGQTSAVFRLGAGGPCKIAATNCLFAQPPTANQDSEAVLVPEVGVAFAV